MDGFRQRVNNSSVPRKHRSRDDTTAQAVVSKMYPLIVDGKVCCFTMVHPTENVIIDDVAYPVISCLCGYRVEWNKPKENPTFTSEEHVIASCNDCGLRMPGYNKELLFECRSSNQRQCQIFYCPTNKKFLLYFTSAQRDGKRAVRAKCMFQNKSCGCAVSAGGNEVKQGDCSFLLCMFVCAVGHETTLKEGDQVPDNCIAITQDVADAFSRKAMFFENLTSTKFATMEELADAINGLTQLKITKVTKRATKGKGAAEQVGVKELTKKKKQPAKVQLPEAVVVEDEDSSDEN
jgi:hypothetical protein